jgi:hypothetical protein
MTVHQRRCNLVTAKMMHEFLGRVNARAALIGLLETS